jgi:hypothetical protein
MTRQLVLDPAGQTLSALAEDGAVPALIAMKVYEFRRLRV